MKPNKSIAKALCLLIAFSVFPKNLQASTPSPDPASPEDVALMCRTRSLIEALPRQAPAEHSATYNKLGKIVSSIHWAELPTNAKCDGQDINLRPDDGAYSLMGIGLTNDGRYLGYDLSKGSGFAHGGIVVFEREGDSWRLVGWTAIWMS